MADDDIPPLEDMTEYLTKRTQEPKTDSSLLGLEYKPTANTSLQNERLLIVNKPTDNKTKDTSKGLSAKCDSKASDGNFGGMKKGFLFASSAPKTNSNKASGQLPFLRGDQKQETSQHLKLDEVQEEMKKVHPLLNNKDWLTDDLLKTIENNSILSQMFSDPSLSQVLEEFHKNPQQVMKTAQTDPKIGQFLQEFCSVMGHHFMSLPSPPQEELITEQLTKEEQLMKESLTKPHIQEILSDPNIKHLMTLLLKKGTEEAQKYLDSNTSADFQTKVRTLIEHGIINVHRQ